MRREEGPQLYCIELRTAHWDASVHWYRQVLGLKVLVRVVDEGYALLGSGGTRLAIIAREAPGEPTRRISLAFEVHDLHPIATRLSEHSIAFEPPKFDEEGLREINTHDPDGNRIRLFSWPEK